MSLRVCDPKRYHPLTIILLYAFTAVLLDKVRHQLPWIPWEKKTSQVFALLAWGTYGEVERWRTAPQGVPFWGLCKQHRITARAAHALGLWSSGPLPMFPVPPTQIVGDEEPWVCRDGLKGKPGDDIKLCCFCFLSQLSWLVPLFASKPTAASPVVSIQALKLFKLFAERCSRSVSSNHAWDTPVKVQPQ